MKRNIKNKILLIISLVTICFSFDSSAQKEQKKFRDTLDNAIDFSDYLINHKGVLPFIIPITEPAVGYGAMVGGLHFLQKKDKTQRPDIAAVFGGYTSNNTWLAGGAYIGYWKKDHIRYRAIVGYAAVNLKYYGFGGNIPIDFTMDSFLFIQQLNFRIRESNFFVGGKYQLAKITIPLFDGGMLPIDPIDLDLWNSGVSLITEYDSLNNFMSPTDGIKVHLSYTQNLEFLGSDKDWGKLDFYSHMYFQVSEKWIPAFRVDAQIATGDIPFYAKPYVSLRGVPALRYQGDMTILIETEQLYNITSRWGVLGFTGIGTAFDSLENMNSDEIVWNAGVGTRYMIARLYGLKAGIDVARGPEDFAFYVTIGTSWLR